METKKRLSACRYCVYALKKYFTIGNKFIFEGVSECTRRKPVEDEKPFKEKVDCLYFEPDTITLCRLDQEQLLIHLFNQLDEISDTLMDISDLLHADE